MRTVLFMCQLLQWHDNQQRALVFNSLPPDISIPCWSPPSSYIQEQQGVHAAVFFTY